MIKILKSLIHKKKNTEEIFTEIYKHNWWGGSKEEYYSGMGSDDAYLVPYIAKISEIASAEGFSGLKFVDIGCGDFRVGQKLLPLCSSYVGVDVVKPLIDRNQAMHGNATTRFVHLDAADNDLPKGDVYFVKQVLQHLSNKQVAAILMKLRACKWVFITEHYPGGDNLIRPNLDIVQGVGTRIPRNSGVCLTDSPFSLPKSSLSMVLEFPDVVDGVIRTYLYKPK